jgi:hypothetical protein
MKFCNLCGRSHIDTLRGHAINYGQYLRLKRERLMTNHLEDRGEDDLRLREKLLSRLSRVLSGQKIQIPTS